MKLQSAKTKIQKAHEKDEWARSKGLRVHGERSKAFDYCLSYKNGVIGEDIDALQAWYHNTYHLAPKD